MYGIAFVSHLVASTCNHTAGWTGSKHGEEKYSVHYLDTASIQPWITLLCIRLSVYDNFSQTISSGLSFISGSSIWGEGKSKIKATLDFLLPTTEV